MLVGHLPVDITDGVVLCLGTSQYLRTIDLLNVRKFCTFTCRFQAQLHGIACYHFMLGYFCCNTSCRQEGKQGTA